MLDRLNVMLALTVLGSACVETDRDPGFGDHPSTAGNKDAATGGGQSGNSGTGGQDQAASGGNGGSGTGGTNDPGGMGGAGSGGGTGGTGTAASGGSAADGGAGSGQGGTGGSSGTGGSAGSEEIDAGPCPQGCSGSTPVCNPDAHTCVACLDKDDCSPGQVCSPDHACVQCNADTDCTALDASRCDVSAHACLGCTADAQCTRFTDTPVCDEGRTKCVACTADTEAARCGDKACALSSGTCTGTVRGSLTACYACEADSECATGMKCIEQVFGTPSQSIGHFCFPTKGSSGCANQEPLKRPYSEEVTTPSIDGAAGTYCLPYTTCAAYLDTIGQKACTLDSACGIADVADGHCLESGAAMGKCSYECRNVTHTDCPGVLATTCAVTTGTTKYCQP